MSVSLVRIRSLSRATEGVKENDAERV